VARLRSWDRLMVPLPFARVRIEFGEPLEVPTDATAAQLDQCRAALEERLNTVTRSVDATLSS
jgi:lysophospholipid acyltransferase (LPLAT)-like uncharacterized protein